MLALRYAAPGRSLLLWGRDPDRLHATAAACRARGADAITRSLDLADIAAVHAAIEADDIAGGIDCALLVAGLGDTLAPGDAAEDPAQVARLGQVNFVAPSAMAADLARRMAARGRGHIVLIGSAAAFHTLPFAAAYAASKAGLAHFAHALRIGVARHGVRVTLISPGFIDTAAARRTPGPKPFVMPPAIAADRIARAVADGRAHLVLPWPFALLRIADRLLPRAWRDRLLLSLAPPAG
jgi:short-subunit dehydrogenase